MWETKELKLKKRHEPREKLVTSVLEAGSLCEGLFFQRGVKEM